MDQEGIEPDLRPTGLYVIPARAAFCQSWSAFAELYNGSIHLCSSVARALADPAATDERDWSLRDRAPAVLLHECCHVLLAKSPPLPVPARLLRVAPHFGAGWHDPLFAAIAATM
jgi:hypothetical protein